MGPTNQSQEMAETVNPPGIHRISKRAPDPCKYVRLVRVLFEPLKINPWIVMARKLEILGKTQARDLGLNKTAAVGLKSLWWSWGERLFLLKSYLRHGRLLFFGGETGGGSFPGGSGSKESAQETQVWSLGREDPLDEEMATHSTILAWEIPLVASSVHGIAKRWTQLNN